MPPAFISRRFRSGILIAPLWVLLGTSLASAEPVATGPSVVLSGVPFSVEVSDAELTGDATVSVILVAGDREQTITVGAQPVTVSDLRLGSSETLQLRWEGGGASVPLRQLPPFTSLLPPLVAILLAILFRQVVLALLAGVWLGAMLIHGPNPFVATLRTVDTYILPSVQDDDNVSILFFTFLLGGMLGVIHRMGGAQGIVNLVAPHARTPRSGQLTTWFLGLVIFFDDYANSLLVGNTMRPLTDKLRISREKLAYIVDSTAAPVVSIAIVSTWIGFEIGLIGNAMERSGIEGDAFSVFLASLPYRFYQIFALVFVLMVGITGRDFGPMLRAERRARSTGQLLRPGASPLADFEESALEPPESAPRRWINLALPVLVVVLGVVGFIYWLGREATLADGGTLNLRTIVGNADSYKALVWASFLGSLTAIALAAGQRILTLNETVMAWMAGVKAMLLAAVILSLAWSIGSMTGAMNTSDYLKELLGDSLGAQWLPVLVFICSGLTAFATGSSWSTMAILIPLVVPLAHHMGPTDPTLLAGAISGVLAGAVWGDHCSPISDTTVLSSMASSADHMDHVNTQLPYAMFVALVAMVVGNIGTSFGLPFWGAWILGGLILFGTLRVVGRRVEATE